MNEQKVEPVSRLMGNARDVVVTIDATGAITAASPSAETVLGFRPEEHIGRNILEFCHPDDVDRVLPILLTAYENAGTTASIDVRAVKADGSLIPVEVLPRNLLATDNAIVLTIRDITDRVEAELARKSTEDRFRLIAECAPIVIFEIDATGQCMFINARWESLTGQSVNDALGYGWLELIPPPSIAMLRDARRAGTARHDNITEFTIEHRHRGPRQVIAQWSPITTGDGIQGFVGTVEDVTERKALQAKLAHQATHDPLTGLPNRTLIEAKLNEACRSIGDDGLAVFFIDLDHFKVINDSLGHDAGDRLLLSYARRLRSIVRPHDVLGRFGGDEFIVIAPGIGTAEGAAALAARMKEASTMPASVGSSRPIHSSVSIGVALAEANSTPESLIRDADAAMYRAKELGRSRVEIFHGLIHERALERLELEGELHAALRLGHLEVHYQPIVDTLSRIPVAVEALVRWRHPSRGLLLPATFIPIAEQSDLIIRIGDFVLDTACRDLQATRSPLSLNVNVSARQLLDSGFVERVRTAVEDSGLPATQLTLELTESVLMTDLTATAAVLNELKALGVGIAVDDFGTGYSSLSYLSRLPVDTLKVDRSFVTGLCDTADSAEIVRAVIKLAQSLSMSATAEGVETFDQLHALRELGCDHAQGYLFAKPISYALLCQLLSENVALTD